MSQASPTLVAWKSGRMRALMAGPATPRIAVALTLLAWFIFLGLTRVIDGDEGYILYAARLLTEGQQLYRDFFFPQAPAVPNVYAWVYRIFGPGWYVARVFAGMVAAGIGYGVFELTRHHTKSLRWAAVGAFLYATCGFTIGFMPIVKTYGLAALCMVGAVVILQQGRSAMRSAIGGLLIVLSMQCRMYMGIVGINAIVYVLRRDGCDKAGIKSVCHLALGAGLGLLLLLPPFLRDFESAKFGMIEFATIRFADQTTLFGSFSQKFDTLLQVLSMGSQDGSSSTQFLGLFALALTAPLLGGLRGNRLSTTIWPTLLVANLLPSETAPQYTCSLIPFVAVEAAVVLGTLCRNARPRLFVPGILLFASMGALEVQRYGFTGDNVPGIYDRVESWRLSHVMQVAKGIDQSGVSEVVTWWPGYLVTTKAQVIPELANHFCFNVTPRLSAERLRRLHLISKPELDAGIRAKRYALVVRGNWIAGHEWLPPLHASYQHTLTVGDVTFWSPR